MIQIDTTTYTSPHTGGSFGVDVTYENTSLGSIQYPTCPSWITYTEVGGAAYGNDYVISYQFTVEENTGGTRNGLIEFECTDRDNVRQDETLPVAQGSGEIIEAPIWKDTFYVANAQSVFQYSITYNGVAIYYGKSYCAPGGSGAYVQVNKICNNFLRNNIGDLSLYNDDVVVNDGVVGLFSLTNADGVELCNYRFLMDYTNDWSGDTPYMMTSTINGHLDPRMKLLGTELNDGVYTDEYTIEVPYTVNFNCSPTSLSAIAGGISSGVSVSCDTYWNTATSDNWITVSPSTSTGGSDTVNITVGRNEESNLRYGNVVFKHKGAELGRVSITQAAAENNKIYYTTTNNQKITVSQTGTTYWRANMTGNTYSNGIGVMSFDGNVGTIPTGAFSGKTTLRTISMPNTIWGIGQYGFLNCTSLESVSMPNQLTTLMRYAFAGCSALGAIRIPSGCTTPGDYVFSGCTHLSDVTIENGVTSFGINAFARCISLSTVTIPSSMTEISGGMFWRSGITGLTIPDSVTSIGDSAFAFSAIKDIHIPSSVSTIGNYVFNKCDNFTACTIESTALTMGNYVFSGSTGLYRIYATSHTAGTVTNLTFYGVRDSSTGTLYYPTGADYSSWMSTDDYYLGKYNWTAIPV